MKQKLKDYFFDRCTDPRGPHPDTLSHKFMKNYLKKNGYDLDAMDKEICQKIYQAQQNKNAFSSPDVACTCTCHSRQWDHAPAPDCCSPCPSCCAMVKFEARGTHAAHCPSAWSYYIEK